MVVGFQGLERMDGHHRPAWGGRDHPDLEVENLADYKTDILFLQAGGDKPLFDFHGAGVAVG